MIVADFVWNQTKNYMWAIFKQIVPFGTDLLLFEFAASTQNISSNVVDCGLKLSASSLGNSFHVIFWNSTSTKDSSVSKPLGRQISDWKLWQDNIGSSVFDFLKFFINDFPFGIDNCLEIIDIFDSNFCILFFRLEFKFNF